MQNNKCTWTALYLLPCSIFFFVWSKSNIYSLWERNLLSACVQIPSVSLVLLWVDVHGRRRAGFPAVLNWHRVAEKWWEITPNVGLAVIFYFPESASVKGSVFRGVMTLSWRCNAHRLLCASSVYRHTGPRGLQLSLFLPEAPRAPRLPPCFDSRSHADPVYVNEIRHKLDQQRQRHIASVWSN